MTFGPAEFGTSVERVLGLRGRLVLGSYVRGDVMPALPEKAAELGLTWDMEASGAISVGLYDGPSIFREMLKLDDGEVDDDGEAGS